MRALQFVFWKDIFVVVDTGRAAADDYKGVKAVVIEQTERNPFGIGVLTIIPPNAVPPSADARRAIATLLKSVGPGLRCACWLVEGSGFQGAMVRAVLLGLQVFGRYPYPTHVTTEVGEALYWMLGHLKGGKEARLGDVATAERYIQAQREQPSLTVSP